MPYVLRRKSDGYFFPRKKVGNPGSLASALLMGNVTTARTRLQKIKKDAEFWVKLSYNDPRRGSLDNDYEICEVELVVVGVIE